MKNSPVIKPASNNQWATTAPARLRVRKRRSANITPPAKSPAKARPMAGTICHGLVKETRGDYCVTFGSSDKPQDHLGQNNSSMMPEKMIGARTVEGRYWSDLFTEISARSGDC